MLVTVYGRLVKRWWAPLGRVDGGGPVHRLLGPTKPRGRPRSTNNLTTITTTSITTSLKTSSDDEMR